MNSKTVLITGASGLLGRALVKKFRSESWHVIGLANSRATDGLIKVDLLDSQLVRNVVIERKPDVIIHAAAERNCNKVDRDFDSARKLNVQVPKQLSELSFEIGAAHIYISTDYVFDGTKPPYNETDQTNPINNYGITKLEGERVTLEANTGACVLRVPVLYGPVEYLDESVVTGLLANLLANEKTVVSHHEIRFPTHVDDVAEACYCLSEALLKGEKGVRGIYQCSHKEAMTKYEMIKVIGSMFNRSTDHIVPDSQPTKGAPRPHNCQMDTSRLESIAGKTLIPFQEGIMKALLNFVPSK